MSASAEEFDSDEGLDSDEDTSTPAEETHHATQAALAVLALAAARRAWRRVQASDVDSWRTHVGPLRGTLTAAQYAAARDAARYIPGTLARRGITDAAAAELVPGAFAGVASDGRSLATLLDQPRIRVLTRIGQGMAPETALRVGLAQLETITVTQVQDAGRAAAGVAIAVRPRIAGYVRYLVPPSCSRCAVLAGQFYRWNAGFLRHPRCFPAGVVVSGPATQAATRRWYEGELVVIATAGGKRLPVTGNHPVLTDRGWVPANLLEEGDHVVGGLAAQSTRPLVVPDEHQMPTRIEDRWGTGGVSTLHRVPTSAEDFHGDGGHGEVDVVLADGLLGNRVEPGLREPVGERRLRGGSVTAVALEGLRVPQELLGRMFDAAHGGVGGVDLCGTLLRGHLGRADEPGLGRAAYRDPGVDETFADRGSTDAVAEAEAVLALASRVRHRDVDDGQRPIATRWDAPPGPLSAENVGAYAGTGRDLLHRLTGQVELDRVVEVSRVGWSGHVYNLTSAEGWYEANGLIVSNCDCRHRVITQEEYADEYRDSTTSPTKYFESLPEAEQNRVFTNAGAQAIRDGADLITVVNARREMTTATAFGRELVVTTEGMTRRGAARKHLGPSAQVRLMPEQIYADALDREDAVRLLAVHGYVR